jgi:hypothetical protein
MTIQIKIFLNQFENNSWFETLGRYIDLENTGFNLEVEVDVKDYFMTMDFNYNEITLHGTEINVPRYLQNAIIDNCYAELIEQYNDEKDAYELIEQYNDEKDAYESDKHDVYRDNNL